MPKYMDSGGLSHLMTKIKAAIAATVTGVKGNAETSYRTGQVNITPANVGAVDKSGDTMTGSLVTPSARMANTYYGVTFGRTTDTPVETILYTGIKWVSGSHMPVVHVTGYAYGLQSPVEFKIAFYIYDNKIGWCGATNMGSWNPSLYLFKYMRGNVAYVAIGFKGSCYYLQLQADVEDEMGKFANIDVSSSAWSWSFLTTAGTIPAVDNGTTCNSVPYRADILKPNVANAQGTLPVANGGTGQTSLAAARNAMGLGNTTGALPVANGGTGSTTAADAANTIFNGLPAWTANPTDDTYFPRQDTGGAASYGKVKFSTVWNYIKDKIGAVLGLVVTTGGGMYQKHLVVTVKTGSTAQSHITLQTLMSWLITTKQYIPSDVTCHITMNVSWSYADNDILQLTADGVNYEIQLAGCVIEFDGYASSYNYGVFRLRIHTSPSKSFTVASGYTAFPLNTMAEYTCNGSGYSPTWVIHAANGVNTAGTGLSKSGTTFNHSNSVTAGTAGTSSATSGTNTLAVPYVTYDAQGHVTASGTHTHTIGNASTSAYGVTQLSSATDSTSEALAATPKAVSSALAAAKTYADGKNNQNAFSNVKVGSTTVAADTTTDTLELAGSNVTLTPDATNDKVTIGITASNVTTALGNTAVARAAADASGNTITSTYATQTAVSDAVGNQQRIRAAAYSGSATTYVYRKIAIMPVDNASNNSSLTIIGRSGGWTQSVFGHIDVTLTNRTSGYSGELITAAITASGAADMFGFVDVVAYKQTNKSAIIYLKLVNYFAYDLVLQSWGATIDYSDTNVTPSGTLIWTLSQDNMLRVKTDGTVEATSITANNGYLTSTLNGNTITIGSANSGYCHISNSANIPFWFNRSIMVENGKGIGGNGNYGLAFLEMNPADNTANNGGYIDFHYNKSTSDYTTRLVEDASGQLSVIGNLRLGSNSQSSVANAGIRVNDVRSTTIANNAIDQAANFYFTNSGTPNSNWWSLLHVKGWAGAYSAWELAGPAHNGDMRTTPLYVRTGNASNTWGSWRKIFDDAQTVPVANGGTGATTAAAARTNLAVVGKADEMLTTNPFTPASLKGPYISKIDNAFYAADKRWTVTKTGSASGGVSILFDGSYETRMQVTKSSSVVILMDFTSTTYFPDYPYGYILVSFYYTEVPESVSGRVYCNYQSHGIGWHDISFSPVADNGPQSCVYRSAHQGYYNISQLEITVTAGSSTVAGITQIEMHLDRPAPSRNPFLSKYTAETLYYNLTAPKFIGALEGNADTASTATDIASTNRRTVANYLLNALDTGSSAPVDNDYYISQYVNGGTTTTTYHRRPMSALWSYIKSKISSWMKNNTAKGNLGWTSTTNDVMPITSNTLAYWDGSYTGNSSNLTYCVKGAFGTMATKNSLAASDIPAHASTTTTYGAASTSNYGHAKLSSATNSSSEDLAATPKAVKAAYDLANSANGTANSALGAATGALIFDWNYSISSNGTITCTPHVYQAGSEVTTNYASTCFVWSYRLGGATPSYVTLTTNSDRSATVPISSLGFGGYVKCDFTPPS